MTIGIYAAAANLGLKSELYDTLGGEFEELQTGTAWLDLSAIVSSFGRSPSFNASGIIPVGKETEFATVDILFVAGFLLLTVSPLVLLVAAKLLRKKKSLSVPVHLDACLQNLFAFRTSNLETGCCATQWPRFGISMRDNRTYLTACANLKSHPAETRRENS